MMIEIEADAPYLLRLQRTLRSNLPARIPSLPMHGLKTAYLLRRADTHACLIWLKEGSGMAASPVIQAD